MVIWRVLHLVFNDRMNEHARCRLSNFLILIISLLKLLSLFICRSNLGFLSHVLRLHGSVSRSGGLSYYEMEGQR